MLFGETRDWSRVALERSRVLAFALGGGGRRGISIRRGFAASPPPPLHQHLILKNSSSCSVSPSLLLSAMASQQPTTASDWPASRVRETFFNFFEGKNHVNWKSSAVVPLNDPTLLFVNAGVFPLLFLSFFISISSFYYIPCFHFELISVSPFNLLCQFYRRVVFFAYSSSPVLYIVHHRPNASNFFTTRDCQHQNFNFF